MITLVIFAPGTTRSPHDKIDLFCHEGPHWVRARGTANGRHGAITMRFPGIANNVVVCVLRERNAAAAAAAA